MLSLLDMLPEDFEALPQVRSRQVLQKVDRLMATARPVSEWGREHSGWA